MILQALNEHYYRLHDDPEVGVAPHGYSLVDISFVIVLSESGDLVDMYQVELQELVPEHKKRSGKNPTPYFLCDKILYSLGIGNDKKEGLKRYQQYKDFNLRLLERAVSPESKALKAFLVSWNPETWAEKEIIRRYQNLFNKPMNLNTIYKIDGHKGYIHQNNEIALIWSAEQKNSEEESSISAQCLVSGEYETIARTHDVAIKGAGGQAAGTALVSFQIESFRSYNKSQSYNAPVSKKAAFAYATALNYLIASKTNRVRLADTTIVFWAEKKGGKKEEAVLSWCLDPVDINDRSETEQENWRIDPATVYQAKTVLNRIKSGLPIGDASFDPETRCYMLGLAPNAARLSVRFWQISSFGDILKRIAQHYCDMELVGLEQNISPWRTLKAIAIQGETKNIPPLLGGQIMKAILSGQMYPQTLYNAVLSRCRAGGDHNGVNAIRAAIVKAFLTRRYRIQKSVEEEALITLSLNENNTRTAYLLGRLFSLLEKVQRDALGSSINAPIRDRYFGAASATPGSVFPLLLRLSRHHIAKSEYGNHSDSKIQDVVNKIEAFPTHLNLEEQGQFILGYYHQNVANYIKKEKKETEEEQINE